MKFKENAIKPGMVIHCPTKKDVEALMTHLKDIGYVDVYYMVDKYSVYGELTCYKMCRTYDGSLTAEYSPIRYYRDDCCYEITEFSDLIESDLVNEPENKLVNAPNTSSNALNDKSNTQMSAAKVLEWLFEHYNDGIYEKVFGSDYSFDELKRRYYDEDNIGEIIDKITAYEAAKKAPKPVDLEWVDYYEFCPEDSPECTLQAMYMSKDVAEEEIKAYFEKYGDGYIVRHERRCRIKR